MQVSLKIQRYNPETEEQALESFTVDVNGGGNTQSMKFVVDKNTQVQGQVKVGSMVMVDYQAMDSGQNLCVRVAAQQG